MKSTQTIRRNNDRYEELESQLMDWENHSEEIIKEMQECMEVILDTSKDEYKRIVLKNVH